MHAGSKALIGWLGALALALGSSNARGFDSFSGTRTETLSERQHSAIVTLHRDHAEIVIRRSVYNAGFESDQAMFFLDLPREAVATRLRSRGIGARAPWFEGELLEAELAAARYRELTGIGGYYPKDPALLSWRSQGTLALQVFPCPPQAEKVLEYTLKLATRYDRGAFRVQWRRLGTEQLPAKAQLVAGEPHARLLVAGKPFTSGQWLPGADELELGLEGALPRLDVELVTVPVSPGRVLTRYAVRAAPELSSLPKRASIVLVIDASRSAAEELEDTAKSALDAYLSHLPDAQVEILTFDRRVKRELGSFQSASAARLALRSLTLGRKNGSEVAQALFVADQLLAAAPSTSPRRILLLTDALTRSTLRAESLRTALATSGALLHVGLLTGGRPALSRTDGHVWSNVVHETGGLVWEAHAPVSPDDSDERARLREVYEEWARPLRLDHLTAYSDGSSLAELLELDTLHEGAGTEQLVLFNASTRSLSVSGELWASPVRAIAKPVIEREELWSALVFGSGIWDELSEPEQMTLAMKGHAVSPVTSYLAIEPGVRPSTEGLTEEQSGMGWGRGVPRLRSGSTTVSGRAPYLDRQAFLEERLRAELQRCGGTRGKTWLELETTLAEVVSVSATESSDDADASVAKCLTEAAWALPLPTGFAEPFETFSVEL